MACTNHQESAAEEHFAASGDESRRCVEGMPPPRRNWSERDAAPPGIKQQAIGKFYFYDSAEDKNGALV
jgi:hypothetical protein